MPPDPYLFTSDNGPGSTLSCTIALRDRPQKIVDACQNTAGHSAFSGNGLEPELASEQRLQRRPEAEKR